AIASIQAVEALKILSGNRDAVSRYLTVVELWDNRLRQVDVATLREQTDCPTCKHGQFPWLAGKEGSRSAVLCGRNAVQLTHPGGADKPGGAAAVPCGRPSAPLAHPAASRPPDDLARRLEAVGQAPRNHSPGRLNAAAYARPLSPARRAILGETGRPHRRVSS